MASETDPKPQYTRYRAGRKVLRGSAGTAGDSAGGGGLGQPTRGAGGSLLEEGQGGTPPPLRPRRPGGTTQGGQPAKPRRPGATSPGARPSRWRRITPKRVVLGLLALIVGWLLLSLVLFLVSSHFERTSLPANVAGELDSAGNPLSTANNILVLGSDRRQKDSREPGAETDGLGRSDTIMLIRTGGGHAARLSIPRDTVIEIPGHGLQKINAAYAFGGPAESIVGDQTLARHPDQSRGRSQLRKLSRS